MELLWLRLGKWLARNIDDDLIHWRDQILQDLWEFEETEDLATEAWKKLLGEIPKCYLGFEWTRL